MSSSFVAPRLRALIAAAIGAALLFPAASAAAGIDYDDQTFFRDSGQLVDTIGAKMSSNPYDRAAFVTGLGPAGGLITAAYTERDGSTPVITPGGSQTIVLPGATSPPVVDANREITYAWADDTGGVLHVRSFEFYDPSAEVFSTDIVVGGDLPPIPVGIATDQNGNIVVAARSRNSDVGERWSVARLLTYPFGAAGMPDLSFGSGGVATGPYVGGGGSSHANALSLTGSNIVLTGRGNFTGADSQPSRLHLLQLDSTGQPDATFGTAGIAVAPIGGTAAPGDEQPIEDAADIVSTWDGALTVIGSVGDGGYAGFALRVGANGTPSGRFAGDGIRRLPFGQPTGLVVDDSGASFVLGSEDGQPRVASLTQSGRLSPRYGVDGVAIVSGPCTRGARNMILNSDYNADQLVLGGLCSEDTLGMGRLTEFTAARNVNLFADVESVPAGGREITLDDAQNPATPDLAQEDGGSLAAAPLRGSPLRGSPLRGSPLRGSPLRGSPLRGSPLRGSPLRGSPLTSIPLRGSGGWTDVLKNTALANRPLQTVTLGNVLDLTPAVTVTLGDIDLVRSPLRDAPLASLLLLGRPLSALPAPTGGWCAFLERAGAAPRCGTAIDLDVNTLLDLALLGVKLDEYLQTPIPLTASVLGSGDLRAPIAEVLIDSTNLAATSLADLPVSTVNELVGCQNTGCPDTVAELQADDPTAFGSATLGDLIGILQSNGRVLTLQELLPGLVSSDELPVEEESFLETVRARAPTREDGLIPVTVSYRQSCEFTGSYRIDIDAPGARLVPGSAETVLDYGEGYQQRRSVADPAPGAPLSFSKYADGDALRISGGCEGPWDVNFEFLLEPPARLGELTLDATVTAIDSETGEDVGSAPARTTTSVSVTGDPDPGPDLATAKPVSPGILYSEHIPSSTDVDAFKIVAPAAGSVVTVSLAGLPADDDLYLQGPSASLPIPAGEAARQQSLVTPIGDSSTDPQADATRPVPDGTTGPLTPASLRSLPLRGTSTHRGTADESVSFLVRDGDVGKTFLATVAGYDGAASNDPYSLRVTVTAPAPMPACINRTVTGGTPGTYPAAALPATTQTLILVNRQRTEAIYGKTATDAMMTRLGVLATTTGVAGAVLPVESHPTLGAAVRSAYTAWDAAPCSAGAANDVVAAVDAVVANASRNLPNLRNVVIVGADDVLPQARVPDLTGLANEREDADQLTVGGRDTPISRSMRTGNVLSDDPYGDLDPQAWLGGTLAVPDVALGRLVETPADVVAQVNRFITNGVITPGSARVTGYDFLSDGANSILSSLRTTLGGANPNASGLINETWTGADARTIFNRAGAGITSVNAHYDQYRALPAATFNGTSTDLVKANETTPAAGSLLFTIGCHAGLSVVDTYAAGAGVPADQLMDWTQRTTGTGSLFVANTGFGYGDLGTIAYSEKLMADFASQLSTKAATVGQSLMYAKQRYAASLGTPSVYDGKTLNEVTYYGLPMYRVTATGAVGAPALPPVAPAAAARKEQAFNVNPVFADQTTARGRFWTADGRAPTVAPNRPIQPRTDLDVTPTDGLAVHGALLDSVTSRDVTGVDPVNARPIIDAASREPEPASVDVAFPAVLTRTDAYASPAGRRSLLALAAGQFLGDDGTTTGRGTQRLFTNLAGRVLRSGSSDYDAPRVGAVTGELVSGTARFTVRTPDTDVEGGVLLYLDPASATWKSATLRSTRTGFFEASGPVASTTTRVPAFYVQLFDAAGNVGASTSKGPGYVAAPPGAAIDGDPVLRPAAAPLRGGYYTRAVRVTLDDPAGGGDPTAYSVRIDDADPVPYSGSITISGDGTHVLVATGPGGKTTRLVIRIDSTPPVVRAAVSRAPDSAGYYTSAVTVTFTCTDSGSGLAPGACPAPRTIANEGKGIVVSSGVVTDAAGNTANASVAVSLDLAAPDTTITRGSGVIQSRTITGTATDSSSGVRNVAVTVNGRSVTPTITCTTTARTSCTWSAFSPVVGLATIRAQATDNAGRTDPTRARSLTVTLG